MEESIRQLQEEKQSIMQDLAAVRELCVKLDATKESLSRQLTAKNIDHEQVGYILATPYSAKWVTEGLTPDKSKKKILDMHSYLKFIG